MISYCGTIWYDIFSSHIDTAALLEYGVDYSGYIQPRIRATPKRMRGEEGHSESQDNFNHIQWGSSE
jgi:hypothetical protein